jgi:hypothetical protein
VILADSGVVTGAFTLGGVLITTTAALWIDWGRQKREDRTRWDKERLLVYSEFLTEARDIDQRIQRTRSLVSLEQSAFRVKLVAPPVVRDEVDRLLGTVESMKDFIEEYANDEGDAEWIDKQLADARSACLAVMSKNLEAERVPWWRRKRSSKRTIDPPKHKYAPIHRPN